MTVAIDKDKVMEVLGKLEDPELGETLMSLGMIRDLKIAESTVSFTLMLTTVACPLKSQIQTDARAALMKVPGVKDVAIKVGAESLRAPKPAGRLLPGVKNVIAIGSGKGGVGKSTLAVNVAVALATMGAKVGLLDADIYGPNIPLLTSVKSCGVDAASQAIIPAENFGVKIVSIGFFLKDSDPVIWRGPMLHGILEKFLGEVRWGDLDYLLIDLPPGTGDVQLSISQMVPVAAAVVVTTPQDIARADVRRAVTMFQKFGVTVAGVVENMSAFECPHCHKTTKIFGEGGGEKIQKEFNIPLLGRIALAPSVTASGENGVPVVVSDPNGEAAQAFSAVAKQVVSRLCEAELKKPVVT